MKRFITVAAGAVVSLLIIAGCADSPASRAGDIATCRDITGVTEEETSAVETIKRTHERFSLVQMYETIVLVVLAVMFIITSILWRRSNALSRHLDKTVRERTLELEHQTRAAIMASQSKTVFLANMSHEIRTPMNSIIGFTELALDSDIPPQTKEYLIKISESAEWLLVIINDILDISKIESGKLELERIIFNLQDVFDHCLAAITPKAIDKGLRFRCSIEPPIDKKLWGDPIRLRQVLINLLTNAVKFTDAGTIKLTASEVISENAEGNTITISFEVADSGIGMNTEQISKVFEPFMQADNSITRRYGGTGLGLAITKNIIELMGGELKVKSEPGTGSSFSFNLTFETATVKQRGASAQQIDDAASVVKPNFTGEVLVCEDNIMNQQVICEHLTRVGLSYVVAENGLGAIAIIEKRLHNGEKPFDLVLMDINMPIMGGLEAAQKIKEMDVKTPLIAMTANIMVDDLKSYKNYGMSDALGKPFTSHELWKILSKYFTPISLTHISANEQECVDEKMLSHLRLNFVKSNSHIYDDIISAIIDSDDIKLAHRLAHTLKSNAAQIGEVGLQNAAAAIEASLDGGKNLLTDEKLISLKRELKRVLKKLEAQKDSLMHTGDIAYTNNADVIKLLDTLSVMLKNRNPECMNLLNEIHAVEGARELARHVENFDFKQAEAELEKLKNLYGT